MAADGVSEPRAGEAMANSGALDRRPSEHVGFGPAPHPRELGEPGWEGSEGAADR